MHELSIALSILECAEQQAEQIGDGQVTAIHLRLGELSGVAREALQSAYTLAREGSRFEAARLEIEAVPIQIFCPTCQTKQPAVSMQELCCRQCGTASAEIVAGREIEITAMEIVD